MALRSSVTVGKLSYKRTGMGMESISRVPKTWLRAIAMLGALVVATGGLLVLEQVGTGAASSRPSHGHSLSQPSQVQANRESGSTKTLNDASESHRREESHHSSPTATEPKHHEDEHKPPKHCDDDHGRDNEKNKHCRPASG